QSMTQEINLVPSAGNASATQEAVTIQRLGNIASGNIVDINVGDNGTVAGLAVGAGVGGFKTINLVVDDAINQAANVSTVTNMDLDVGSQARTLNITGGTSPTNAVGQADVLDLTAGGNVLLNSLEKIDLSGFAGQVTLAMESGVAAGQTDVNFNLSAYNAEITLSTDGAAGVGTGTIAGITHNSVFDFNGAGSVQVPTQWVVHNIVNAGAAGAGVNNNTLFDVRDLGINNYAELEALYVDDGDIAVDAYGKALAVGTAVVCAEAQHLSGNVTWEIIVDAVNGVALTGVNGLAEANFGF